MNGRKHILGRVTSIINPGAAKKKWLRRKRLKRFLEEKLPGRKFDLLAEKESTIELVRAVSLESETIVAVGGDGTVADVLQGIRQAEREKGVLLGIIPLGSGNAFRKSLAIPNDVKKAVQTLLEGEAKEIDLMDIEGKVAGFASIGATACATKNKVGEGRQGFFAHVWAGRRLLSLSRWDVEAELEDGLDDEGKPFARKILRLKILDCVVAKSNYFGYSWRIAPKASLEDGYLDITFFEMSGLKYVLLLPLTYFGLIQRRLKHFKAKRLILRGQDLPVQYHGEIMGTRNRVAVEVLPKVIRVICPPKKT